ATGAPDSMATGDRLASPSAPARPDTPSKSAPLSLSSRIPCRRTSLPVTSRVHSTPPCKPIRWEGPATGPGSQTLSIEQRTFMTPALVIAVTLLVAYLVGAIPFGYLVARWRGVDILHQGSGNIGATNVGRVLGRRFGIL